MKPEIEPELIIPENKRNKQPKAENTLLYNIIMLVIGILFVSNTTGFITLIFKIIGLCCFLFAAYKGYQYLTMKKQLGNENIPMMMSAVGFAVTGFFLIIFSSALEVGLRFILGIFLLSYGVRNIRTYLVLKEYQKATFYLIKGILFIFLGFYSIIFKNLAFVILGIVLIVVSTVEIVQYFMNLKK